MRGKRTLKNFRSFRPSVLSALKKYWSFDFNVDSRGG
jgi:hypothetical protein